MRAGEAAGCILLVALCAAVVLIFVLADLAAHVIG